MPAQPTPEILPGIGVGALRYGMTEAEAIAIVGDPARTVEEEYLEGSGDFARHLFYSDRHLQLSFDSDDDYRLGRITIDGAGYLLLGRDPFAAPIEEIRRLLLAHTGTVPEYEDRSEEGLPRDECLTADDLGLMLWFDDGRLEEIQAHYLFEADDDTVIWPPAD